MILVRPPKGKRNAKEKASYYLREYRYHLGKIVDRNVNITGSSSEISEKDNPHYKVSGLLAQICFTDLQKVEFVSDELGHLAEDISKQNGR